VRNCTQAGRSSARPHTGDSEHGHNRRREDGEVVGEFGDAFRIRLNLAPAGERRRQNDEVRLTQQARKRLGASDDVDAVVAAKGLHIVSDAGALGVAVDEAIVANPEVAEKVRSGKLAAVGPLVGAVMKATRGQADAATVRELLLERLGAG
jgi:Glu-tRNA(Gln) amidotransferase subunit E-like FAD-binding protein